MGEAIAVAVAGAAGRMGATTCAAVRGAEDMELVAEIDAIRGDVLSERLQGVSVLVDFTAPDGVIENVRACLQAGVSVVIGTTGFDLDELAAIAAGASANVFFAPNFAIGAVLMMRFAGEAARHMAAAEVIELHHDGKVDAPSGTAIHTANAIEQAAEAAGAGRRWLPGPEGAAARGMAIGATAIHSVRLPGLIAHQEVLFGDLGQTLSIRHDTSSREAFMPGVLLAIRRVQALPERFTVGLEQLLWPAG